jgi:hypothetical protein
MTTAALSTTFEPPIVDERGKSLLAPRLHP